MTEIVEVMAKAIADSCSDAEVESIPGSYVPTEAWPGIARAALSALKEAGYAVVPVVPSDAMVKAGTDATEDYTNPHPTNTREIWSAMLSASPVVE